MSTNEPLELTPAERAELAEKLGVHEQYLYQCLTGRKAMKPIEATRIERESGGRLTRAALRPKDYWLVWPDLAPPTKRQLAKAA
jgi:DNA-binding transcriptional regulator YdaS (Cro superfamily)